MGTDTLPCCHLVGLSGGFQTLTYICPPGLTDITYIVEVSSDLQTWSSGPGSTQTISTTLLDSQHEQIVVGDLTPTTGVAHRFIRQRVTLP